MKKFINLLILSTLVLSLTGCDTDTLNSILTEEYYSSEDEVTLENNEEMAPNDSEKLSFSTVDIDGNTVTDEIIKNAKVVMINFWEPWCGPCVREMPDLQKLYEKYKEQGLLILGVFSTPYMDNDARQILSECNISYPVVRADSSFEKFMTDYVPTTVFADTNGYILSDEPIIGANSYEDWEKIIESYLN